MATAKKSPIEIMKDTFKDKETLVERVLGVLPAGDQDAEALKKKLLGASNKKLLRLLAVGSEIKSKYGSAEKLAEVAAAALGKAKDQAYVGKLTAIANRTPARVLDLLKTATARSKATPAA